jgi:hypothetical protein
MLAEARDICAIFFLEHELGILREKYLEDALADTPQGPDYWQTAEAAILRRRDGFYTQEVRHLVKANCAKISDGEDLAGRTQKLAEHAVFFTHRKLIQIPYVGQPEYMEA